jgi:hypothetical protein
LSYTSFEKVNNLKEIHFVAGSNYTYRFDYVDQSGGALDLSTATMKLYICEYGNYENVLVNKTGLLIGPSTFKAYIVPVDTTGFNGIYSYQAKVILADATVIPAGQGIMYITGGMQG